MLLIVAVSKDCLPCLSVIEEFGSLPFSLLGMLSISLLYHHVRIVFVWQIKLSPLHDLLTESLKQNGVQRFL